MIQSLRAHAVSLTAQRYSTCPESALDISSCEQYHLLLLPTLDFRNSSLRRFCYFISRNSKGYCNVKDLPLRRKNDWQGCAIKNNIFVNIQTPSVPPSTVRYLNTVSRFSMKSSCRLPYTANTICSTAACDLTVPPIVEAFPVPFAPHFA